MTSWWDENFSLTARALALPDGEAKMQSPDRVGDNPTLSVARRSRGDDLLVG